MAVDDLNTSITQRPKTIPLTEAFAILSSLKEFLSRYIRETINSRPILVKIFAAIPKNTFENTDIIRLINTITHFVIFERSISKYIKNGIKITADLWKLIAKARAKKLLILFFSQAR